MIPPLDVFSVKKSEPTWLGAAETLPQALEKVRQNGVGSYFVFSQKTGHKTTYEVGADGSVRPMDPAKSASES